MSESFTFEVEVTVDGWDGTDDRDPGQYASDVLYGASLRDCERMDGYADLHGTAHISGVSAL